eukprot:SAG31_NODE_4808_length_2945_cov_2.155306_7_plen_44_part_01
MLTTLINAVSFLNLVASLALVSRGCGVRAAARPADPEIWIREGI